MPLLLPCALAQALTHVSVVHELPTGCSHTLWAPTSRFSHAESAPPPTAAPPCLHLSQLLAQPQQAGDDAGFDSMLQAHVERQGAARGGQYFLFVLPAGASRSLESTQTMQVGCPAHVGCVVHGPGCGGIQLTTNASPWHAAPLPA